MTSHARSVAMLVVALMVWLGHSEQARAHYPGNGAGTYSYQTAPGAADPTLSNCDDCSKAVQLPFAFPFYGQTFTQINISANGFVTLGTTTPGAGKTNRQLFTDGTSSVPDNFIAPLWDDWDTRGRGDVYFGMVGDRFIIEWWDVWHNGDTSGGGYTFELKLFTNGRIEFHYMNMRPGKAWDLGASATIGFQESSTTVAHPVHFNIANVTDGRANAYAHPGNEAVYLKTIDMLGAARAGVKVRLTYTCQGLAGTNQLDPVSTKYFGGWAVASANRCNPDPGNHAPLSGNVVPIAGSATSESGPLWKIDTGSNLLLVTDTAGKPIAIPNHLTPAIIRHGQYAYVTYTDLTPAPTRTVSWALGYPDTAIASHTFTFQSDGSGEYGAALNGATLPARNATSFLHYYQVGTAIDKPIVLVPGFDPLDETSTAYYLAGMASLAGPLMAQGYDVIIGDFGDKWQPMQNLELEVRLWVNDAFVSNTASDKRVDAVGVSMGGVLVRQALKPNGLLGDMGAQVKRWFSIDSPHRGANLTTDRGVQTGVMRQVVGEFGVQFGGGGILSCSPSANHVTNAGVGCSNDKFEKLFAPAAMQMKRTTPSFCTLDDEPENSRCTPTTAHHTAFYNTLTWPTTTATRYAVAFGNGDLVNVKPAATKLYDFTYAGGWCFLSEDRDWNGTKRDYIAGSKYLTAADVNADAAAPCDTTFRVRLLWEPSFINVDSALNMSLTPTVEEDPANPGAYPPANLWWGLSPYWTAIDANTTARNHTRLSCRLRDQLCTWIHGTNACASNLSCEP